MIRNLLAVLLVVAVLPARAADLAHARNDGPVISIIIDDLGNNFRQGQRTVSLPGPVTCAFLPDTPYARQLARAAHAQGKEVMAHVPMEAMQARTLGPGALTMDMTESAFKTALLHDLTSLPYIRGVNNHMGSLLTRHPGHMGWLMEVVAAAGDLFFVDSRTTDQTVASRLAREYRVPLLERDVFLDARTGDARFVKSQFRTLVRLARKNGMAVGIGHPHETTLSVLEEELGRLSGTGIRLVTASELIEIQNRRTSWHASLYHSPRAVKN